MPTELIRKIAAYDLFLKLSSEKELLMEGVLRQQLRHFLEYDFEKAEQKAEKRAVPQRLRRRLIGELVLFFDRDFPIIMNKVGEVDERLSRIVFEVLLLADLVFSLPESVRDVVLSVITDGEAELQERLKKIHQAGSEQFWLWLDAALSIAERRIKKIRETLKDA